MRRTLFVTIMGVALCLAAGAASEAAEHHPIMGVATINEGGAARVDSAAPARPIAVPRMAGPAHFVGGPSAGSDAAAPRRVAAPSAPPLTASFLGIPYTNFFPPDPCLAAGPDKLVLVVNGGIALFSKTGSNLLQRSLEDFFNGQPAPGVFTYDPKMVFDPHSGRFIIVAVEGQDSPNSLLRIAVSKSSSPNNLSIGPTAASDWFGFNIDADKDGGVQRNNNWADFPSLGVDQYNLYVTANMFSNAGLFQYVKVWIIPKATLIGGGPPTVFEFGAPPAAALANPQAGFPDFTIMPALNFGAGAEHLLATNALSLDGATGYVTFWTVNNPSASPTLSSANLFVAGWKDANVPACPQAGGRTPLDAGDTRILRVVERNGSIWATHTQPNATTGATRAEVRWYQINPVGPAVVQFGEVSDPTRCYFYPAIEPDAFGNVGLVMSGVDASIFGSAFYTGRLFSDPPGTMQSVATLQLGLSSYVNTDTEGNRWGDFGGISWDPTTGDIWMLHEYASATVDKWSTWVGKMQLGAIPSITPTSSTPSATPTVTPTPVPTNTPTLTFSPTATLTQTATRTATRTRTSTPTFTVTATFTPTPTRTPDSSLAPYCAYVALNSQSAVLAIGGATTGRISLPNGGPRFVAKSPNEATLYVPDALGEISVIDTATNSVTGTITVDAEALAFAPNGAFAYSVSLATDSVSVIDTAAHSIVGVPIALGAGASPWGIAIKPDGTRGFVANAGNRTISVIDLATRQLVDAFPVSAGIRDVAVSSDGQLVYVAPVDYTDPNQPTATLAALNSTTGLVTSTVPICSGDPTYDVQPNEIVLAPDDQRAYVSCVSGVNVVNPSTSHLLLNVAGVSGSDDRGNGLALTPDGRFLYGINYECPPPNQYYSGCGVETIPAVVIMNTASNTLRGEIVVGFPGDTVGGIAVAGFPCNPVLVTPTPSPTGVVTPSPCVGDCNGDHKVTVDELVKGVNIALGTAPLSDCPVFDANNDGHVTVDELVTAVNNALNGCGR